MAVFPLTGTAANITVLSMNVIVPVAIPPNRGVTVAVRVTGWNETEGLLEDVRVTVLVAWLTICKNATEVLSIKLPMGAYVAVMECWP